MQAQQKKTGVVHQLGEFLAGISFQDLPAEAVEAAKGRILDTLSCCCAGRDLTPGRIAVSLSKKSSGNCTVFGYGHKTSMLDAALANGTMAHSTSQDDVISGIAHGGSVVVPAAFAAAEEENASGAQMLLAVVLGYELISRILKATGAVANPAFRPGAIFTTVGAAAAAGKIMALDEAQLASALGYAASITPGIPNEGWWGGETEPILELGISSRLGLLAAMLAREGATAALSVFEGSHGFFRCWAGNADNASRATERLGKDFAITKTYIKPFAACGANQIPIQIASTLAVHGLKGGDIVKVVEKLRPGSSDYAGLDYAGPFRSQTQALMSMQFCAAAAILGRSFDTPGFISEHYDDPEVGEVAAKVELVPEEGRSFPGFEVYTGDGSVLAAEQETIDRSIHIPTIENMKAKFTRLATKPLGKERTEEILHMVVGLETVSNARELTVKLENSTWERQ